MLQTIALKKPRLSVGFVLAPNFTMLAFSAFVDTLRLAADEGDRSRPIHCTWSVLSHDMRPVKASCGIEVTPTAGLEDPGVFDYIVVVGGLLSALKMAPAMNDYLRRAAGKVPLVGICTGPFVLARLGLMKDRRSCVSWYVHADFTNEFPDLDVSSDELFIDDGDRLHLDREWLHLAPVGWRHPLAAGLPVLSTRRRASPRTPGPFAP